MVVPPSDPLATSDLGASGAGGTRKLRLDEMLADREQSPLPPPPVLTIDPVPVDAAPVTGLRGARKRLAEVEALARRNLRAAEEARRVVHEERALLEEESSARTKAERTAASLRREIERLRSTEEQRAAQARFAAAREARSELETEIERVHDEHARVVDELDRLRGTLFDHDSLLDEYSRRLREEQEAQARAHGDQVRAEEALRVVERNLEIATETARRRAEDDAARFAKVDEAWRDACLERDRLSAELRAITTGDGELSRLRSELEAAREDTKRLLADLDTQAARADQAEKELATARDARAEAERTSADATHTRDQATISLETTRAELAERTEALEAERSQSQARIAELTAQLASTTRTAESATERSVELEARLEGAIAARDEAFARAETMNEQLDRARADAEHLRTQAASIGDELAATQVALGEAREAADEARHVADEARYVAVDEARRADEEAPRASHDASPSPSPTTPSDGAVLDASPSPTTPSDGAVLDAPPDVATARAVSEFDAALASAFGQELSYEPTTAAEEPAAAAPSRPAFRVVEPLARTTRAGGPVVELEAAMLRGLEPVETRRDEDSDESAEDSDEIESEAEPAEVVPPRRAPEPAWRRTAMAELTALATDSDDLTPRRRR